MGWGCSGGSYQQDQIADNYPGLLDGILPGCSFPRSRTPTVSFITDARLLDHYFGAPGAGPGPRSSSARSPASPALRDARPTWGRRAPDRPARFCGVAARGAALRPADQPGGVRCDVYDHAINVCGRDPATGFARRPLDNVGVQYGLGALRAGAITSDAVPRPERARRRLRRGRQHRAGPDGRRPLAGRRAYRSGRVTNGGRGLAAVPIIDYRAYNDDAER